MKISKKAYEEFELIHREYVAAGRGVMSWGPGSPDRRALLAELRDAGLVKPFNLGGAVILTELGKRGPSILVPANPAVHVGDTINISNSTVGAMATRGSTATGSATISITIGQDDVRAAIGELQKALIDKIDDLDQKTYDFLSEILLKLRKIQIEAGPHEKVLAQLQEKFDEDWAKQAVAEMKPALAKIGTSLGELAKHPLAKPILALIAASLGLS